MRILATIIIACWTSQIHAQTVKPESRDFGLYHMNGISADVARGDILYCMAFARDAYSQRSKSGTDAGLVGAVLSGLLGAGPTSSLRNITMQKCMTAHGYHLYLVDEGTWKTLVGDDATKAIKHDRTDAATIDGLAEFASRPLPDNKEFKS